MYRLRYLSRETIHVGSSKNSFTNQGVVKKLIPCRYALPTISVGAILFLVCDRAESTCRLILLFSRYRGNIQNKTKTCLLYRRGRTGTWAEEARRRYSVTPPPSTTFFSKEIGGQAGLQGVCLIVYRRAVVLS